MKLTTKQKLRKAHSWVDEEKKLFASAAYVYLGKKFVFKFQILLQNRRNFPFVFFRNQNEQILYFIDAKKALKKSKASKNVSWIYSLNGWRNWLNNCEKGKEHQRFSSYEIFQILR